MWGNKVLQKWLKQQQHVLDSFGDGARKFLAIHERVPIEKCTEYFLPVLVHQRESHRVYLISLSVTASLCTY